MRNFRAPNLQLRPGPQDRAHRRAAVSARACAPSPRARPPSRAALWSGRPSATPPPLRERRVEVAALRRLHARRTARLARALGDQAVRIADEGLELEEALARD